MHPTSSRWKEISPSQYQGEKEALGWLRKHLPDVDPVLAWSNFEFLASDGSINEVDVLVLTEKGFYLVELKGWHGEIRGDAGTWLLTRDGKTTAVDNPLLLANRKAKKLKSLLSSPKFRGKFELPFIEPLVFCSDKNVQLKLDPALAGHVFTRDAELEEGKPGRGGILGALLHLTPTQHQAASRGGRRIDRPLARAVAQAMEQAGIRPSTKARRVGDYRLEALLFDGPNYQDWQAAHASLPTVTRRIRLFPVPPAAAPEARATIVRAARREFQILQGVRHAGILDPREYTEIDVGPALIFEHMPEAIRLDHFLRERGGDLPQHVRLHLLRQLADAVRYAHGKRLVHRALSPESVLVLNPTAALPQVQILNWQTGHRDAGTTTGGYLGTQHLSELVEAAASVYMAPEASSDPDQAGEHLDVFSLGAIAYHLFTGRRPAESFSELAKRVREEKGLLLAGVLDGAGRELQDLVQFSTHPEVLARLGSAEEFLELLDKVEDELTRPDEEPVVSDPTEAKPGERLPGGFLVKKRLGKGSLAVVYVVDIAGEDQILKLAIDPEHNDRIVAEREVLEKLRHHHIVELYGPAKVGEREGLLIAKAGDETLAQRLRKAGRLHLDLLERFGEDLLDVVAYLEQMGIPHRDLKPDNLGISAVGRGDKPHLILFDFSLTRTAAEQIRAGTPPYLEPFLCLRKPARWDVAAERYAAAVTLYEMVTGVRPRWGDERSDPAVLECEVTLDSDRFPPAARELLTSFFDRALRRDPRARFDNADEMLRAWRQIFVDLDRSAEEPSQDLEALLAAATPDTSLAELGLSTRLLDALEHLNVVTVLELLQLPMKHLTHMRGVQNETRKQLVAVAQGLRARFADVVAPVASASPLDAPPPSGAPKEPAASDDEETLPAEVRGLDGLVAQLLPVARGKRNEDDLALLRLFLGLTPIPDTDAVWPSQTEVARAHGCTSSRVSLLVAASRKRWQKLPSLTGLREDLVSLLESQGEVMTAREVETAILALRGATATVETLRTQLARAAARAAVQTEREQPEPRLAVRRSDGRVLISRLAAQEEGGGAEGLFDYALRLGLRADTLASTDPLPSPVRVIEALQAVNPAPDRSPLPPARLVRLAAAASKAAALSSRMELYPRAMEAARALKLAQGALLGSRAGAEGPVLTIAELHDRVRARYPEAQRLPERPALDLLLQSADLAWKWSPSAGDSGGYVLRDAAPGLTSSANTSLGPRVPTATAPAQMTPAIAEAQAFEERLERGVRDGTFLVLTVAPKYHEGALLELSRRFDVTVLSFEALLLRALREEADRANVRWDKVLAADATPRDSNDFARLRMLVARTRPQLEAAIALPGQTVLLTHPGLIARYGFMDLLQSVKDRIDRGPAGGGPRGLLLLVPSDEQSTQPMIDDVVVPVLGRSLWARIPEKWLENAHRGHATASAR